MKTIKARNLAWALLGMLLMSGCGNFFNNLRRDIDEPDSTADSSDVPTAASVATLDPTVGGAWKERGYMKGPDGGRSPASVSPDADEESLSQVSNSVSSSTVATLEPQSKRLYKNGTRATRDDFIDQSQEEGSLWASSGQTNYFFTKNKIRSPGDLITLTIEGDLYRDIGIEVKRTLSLREKAKEVGIVQDKFRSKFFSELEGARKDNLALSAAAPERAPASGNTPNEGQATPSPTPTSETMMAPPVSTGALTPEELEKLEKMVPRASLTDVDIYPALEMKAGETMMGEIVERFPNGNFKIRTVKRIPYKKGPPRVVSVIGIVKGTDINEETDLVSSGKMYEYRVEVSH